MENNSLLSFAPTPLPSHFLLSLSSTSPLLPCCSSNWWLEVWRKRGWGLWARQMICSLPVEAYVALQCWGGSECGSRSYAGNVSLRSARAGPEKPTTLFKEMAVRGPSATLSASPFLCLSLALLKAPLPSFYKNDNYFPLWKKGLFPYLLGRRTHTQREKCVNRHTHRGVLVVWCG